MAIHRLSHESSNKCIWILLFFIEDLKIFFPECPYEQAHKDGPIFFSISNTAHSSSHLSLFLSVRDPSLRLRAPRFVADDAMPSLLRRAGGDDRSAAQSAAGTRERQQYSLFSATGHRGSRFPTVFTDFLTLPSSSRSGLGCRLLISPT